MRSTARRAALATELLAAAHAAYAELGAGGPPEYHLVLPADWHGRPEVAAALSWRREAARRAGLPASLERLRYEWMPQAGLPEPSGHVSFGAEPDDEVFVDLFRRVLPGTLDATSRRKADQVGVEAQARNDVVLPEHRGQGYAVDILIEVTRILASETDPERIRADTDLANTPMTRAFERTGYRNDACRLVLSAR